MCIIQEFEEYCASHPDPWYEAIQAQKEKPWPPLLPLQLPQSWYQQCTPPAPQEVKKEQAIPEGKAEITAEKQEQRPLYQASMEDNTEHGNNVTASKSMLSTKSRLCTAPTSGDQAAYLSKALLFTSQHTSYFGSASFFVSFLGSFFGYIRCIEGMEASGQG